MYRMIRKSSGYQKQAEIKLVSRMYRMIKNIKWILEASRNKACDQNVQNNEDYQVDVRSKQK